MTEVVRASRDPDEAFALVCHESADRERQLIRACFGWSFASFAAGVYVGWFVISTWF